ncbi:iron-containing alcohol dehydrogenase [Faecalicatena orotica]|uniref:iron-containing alcohol dehydrogenase n=1 Tax=Faecalicatena orotica TaxID=1544 RepID=UPI003217AEDC
MLDFEYYNPTRIIFGRESIAKIHSLLENYGENIMLLYGGGSIKKNGIFDKVMEQLRDKNVIEMGGIEPNPTIETIRRYIQKCREEKVEFILGVGGGSVMDSAKMIGAGAVYDGDVWDFFKNHDQLPEAMLPVATVVTLAGTGSEANQNFVVTNPDTCEKIGKNGGPACFPEFAVCDPQLTFTVNAYQTASGAFDTIAHVFEHYFAEADQYMPVQDGMQEAVIRAVITELPRAIKEPDNYEARANLMWAAQQALFGIADMGKGHGERVEHKMEHILSARYNCAHGAGLAVVVPPFRKHMCRLNPAKYRQFAENVFHIDCVGLSDYEAGMKGITALEDFIKSVGLPASLREIGAESETDVDFLAEELVRQGRVTKGTGIGLKELKEMYASVY